MMKLHIFKNSTYIVFDMMHNGVLMDIQIDQIATPYSDNMARRYFKEMMLGIEYCR